MWLMILRLWERVGGYLVLAGVVLAGLFAVRQLGKSAGRQEVQQKIGKATIKAMGDARDARDEIESRGDAAVRARARERMRKRGAGLFLCYGAEAI